MIEDERLRCNEPDIVHLLIRHEVVLFLHGS